MSPKKIAAFAIGPFGAALLSLITLPIITWLFSQEDIGKVAMLQVAISLAILLFSLGLDQAYVREFHEENNKSGLLKHSIFPGLIMLMLSLIGLLFINVPIAGFLFDYTDWLLSFLVYISLLSAFILRFFSLVLRMNEQGFAFSVIQLLPKLLLLIIIGSGVILGADNSLTNLVAANSAAIFISCLILIVVIRSELTAGIATPISWMCLKKMLQFGLPLVLGGIAYWGLTAIDKIFLQKLVSFEELGLYSVAVSLAGAATILQSVFSTIWAPTVYKWASAGEGGDSISKVSRYILALVVVLFCCAGLMSWVVTLFLPSSYNSVQWVLVSCLGAPLLYTLSETTVVGIGISRRNSFSMLASIGAFVVNIFGNWLMVPSFGAAGAAVSTCVSFWILFILRTEFANYLWRPISRRLLYVYTTIVVLGATIFTLYGTSFPLYMNFFWAILLASVFIVFRNEIIELYYFFRNKISLPGGKYR